MGSPVYIEIFKEERMLDLYVKMGETYQLLDSYRICNYSGGLGRNSARAISRVRKGSITSPAASSNPTAASIKRLTSASRTPTIAPMVMKGNT